MRRFQGILYVIISAIAFGAIAIFARAAYDAGSDPISLLFLRFSIASMVMLPCMKVRHTPFPRGRPLLGLFLMGAVGYVGQSFCYFTALTLASAGLVAILLYVYPAIVTLFSVLLFKERLTLSKIVALILALTGTFFIIEIEGGGTPLGIALAMRAPFIYSAYILTGSRITSHVGPLWSSTVVMISAGVVFGGLIALKGLKVPQTLHGWGGVFGVALVSTVIAILTFFAGLERVGPTHAAMLSTFEPITTVTLAAIFLDETVGPMKIAGGV